VLDLTTGSTLSLRPPLQRKAIAMNPLEPATARVRVRFSHCQRIEAAPSDIFPLLCPVREYDWIPDWDCRMVYSTSGLAEPGCIFQTDRPADGGLDTWLVSRHEPPSHIGFVRMNPLRAIQYDIDLTRASESVTVLRWEQVITALTAAGDSHVAQLEEAAFARSITGLETLLNRYLEGASAVETAD
jgi:hypothetical protein